VCDTAKVTNPNQVSKTVQFLAHPAYVFTITMYYGSGTDFTLGNQKIQRIQRANDVTRAAAAGGPIRYSCSCSYAYAAATAAGPVSTDGHNISCCA